MYHILVVDDEEMIRKLIAKYAVYEGHTVTEAADGMEAISFLSLSVKPCSQSSKHMPKL